MPEFRCSQTLAQVTMADGKLEAIPCGKLARRRDRTLSESKRACDYGWLDGCCDDCVAGLRKDVGLTDEEIDMLYPLEADAIRWARAT